MKPIPTAEELLDAQFPDFESLERGNIWVNVENLMIEFAKLHVQAALEAATENAKSYIFDEDGETCSEVRKESILKSYPLENIK